MTDETTPLPPEDGLLDLLLVVAENARLLIFGPLIAGLAALGISFVVPPTFTATTRILPPQQQQGAAAMLASQLGALGGLAGAAGLNIKNPADTYVALITIEVDDKDPKRAADIANAYVRELHKLTGSLAITEAQQRRVFFEKQLQLAQENLKKAELALGQTGAGESLIRSAPQAMVEGIARLKALV